mmetsp:Transcript_61355/g.143638  ORF Transcript_61355/g.143638 Transcript_61355/m.143638 type:complete len:728 (+) Transcript_61355:58-2241(+)
MAMSDAPADATLKDGLVDVATDPGSPAGSGLGHRAEDHHRPEDSHGPPQLEDCHQPEDGQPEHGHQVEQSTGPTDGHGQDVAGALPDLNRQTSPFDRPGTGLSHRESVERILSRPGTAMSLCAETGQGEDSMVSFISSYMKGILQPFGQTVDELHRYVWNLSETTSAMSQDVDSHSEQIAQQAILVAELRQELNRTSDQVAQAQTLLEATVAEKSALEAEMHALKPKVGELDERTSVVQEAVQELQPRLKETRCKLARCEESKFETDRDIAQLRASLEHVKGDIEEWDKTHELLLQSVNGTKQSFETRFQEFHALIRDVKEEKKGMEAAGSQLEGRIRGIEEKAHEANKKIQEHAEKHSTANTLAAALKGRTEAMEKINEDMKERLNKADMAITDYRLLAVENKDNISKLMSVVSSPDVFVNLEKSINDLTKTTKQNKTAITALSTQCNHFVEQEEEAKKIQEHLGEQCDLLGRRAARVEKAMGLEEISEDGEAKSGVVFKSGILLTEQQISEFQKTFNDFDLDGSNTISISELETVLQQIGLDPPMDIVYAILEAIDVDKSGDIDFDEFCSLLTKMLGPDGKVDVERMLRSMFDSMSYEAKQRKAVETVIAHTTELREHKEMIFSEHSKLDDVGGKVADLQGGYDDLATEVKKLRQGFELNQEYWRGFSRGLKETRKTVHAVEGEEVLLPSAQKLRNTLPPLPLTARPSTAQTASTTAQTAGYSTF